MDVKEGGKRTPRWWELVSKHKRERGLLLKMQSPLRHSAGCDAPRAWVLLHEIVIRFDPRRKSIINRQPNEPRGGVHSSRHGTLSLMNLTQSNRDVIPHLSGFPRSRPSPSPASPRADGVPTAALVLAER